MYNTPLKSLWNIPTTMKRCLQRKVEIDGPFGQNSSGNATITDLLDELVEKIIEDLDDNRFICWLSLTCKRVHLLVLPMFFSCSKLEHLQNRFLHCYNPVPELLEAIRTALFIHHLSLITFYFTSGIEQVMSDICSLCGLLAHIPLVGKIQLGLLQYVTSLCMPQHVWHMERWGREFLKLLEIIANSGCRDLELLDPLGVLPNNYNFLYVATLLPVKPMSRRLRHPRGACAHSHSTSLLAIQILSPRLLQPFFIGWIIDMLKVHQESLICIHLNVTSIDLVLLSHISKSMNLPVIKEVKIFAHSDLEWAGLCSFLNCRPSISSLCFDGILPVKDPQIPDPPIILPYLAQLTALSLIVNLLLQNWNRFSLLSSIHVLLSLNAQMELDLLPAIATYAHISSLQLSNGIQREICSMLERHIHEDRYTQIITSLSNIRRSFWTNSLIPATPHHSQ